MGVFCAVAAIACISRTHDAIHRSIRHVFDPPTNKILPCRTERQTDRQTEKTTISLLPILPSTNLRIHQLSPYHTIYSSDPTSRTRKPSSLRNRNEHELKKKTKDPTQYSAFGVQRSLSLSPHSPESSRVKPTLILVVGSK